MPRWLRILLIALAVGLALFAVLALIYALGPAPVLRDTFPIQPTLLIPPGGAP